MHESLVGHPRALGPVQADEIGVKKHGGIVWMALAMMIRTRLWLAGVVSPHRALSLILYLIERVRRGAAPCPLLFCTDGLCASSLQGLRSASRRSRDIPCALGPASAPLPEPGRDTR